VSVNEKKIAHGKQKLQQVSSAEKDKPKKNIVHWAQAIMEELKFLT
jgi:hypothetical protein